MLLDRDEEMFLAKEYLLEQKIRNYDRGWSRQNQGGAKGKGKEGKGKSKDKDKGGTGGGSWEKQPPKKTESK